MERKEEPLPSKKGKEVGGSVKHGVEGQRSFHQKPSRQN
jgi:hypothetical protein